MKSVFFRLFPVFTLLLAIGAYSEAQTTDSIVGQGAILTQGNLWQPGIPGFGENAFQALYGSYRLEGSEFDAEVFSVWMAREPLYFGNEWQTGTAIGGLEAYRSTQGNRQFIGFYLQEGAWTAVFEMPASLGEARMNRLIEAWIGRFLYFFSLAKGPGEISLPAVVNF
jgi:hypothetical protein